MYCKYLQRTYYICIELKNISLTLKRRFLSNLTLLIILNLLIKPFWFFGIEVGVQNQVGEEMYGFYFSLFNFAFILNILLDLGINNFNNRAVARDSSVLKDHLAAIVPLKLGLSLVYALIVFIAGKLVGYSEEQMALLRVLVVNQFLASFILYFRTNISGLQYYRTDSLLSVMDRALMILFTGLLLWGNLTSKPFQISWFVYAQTLSYTLTLLTVAAIVRYRSGRFIHKINFKRSVEILRLSYPFALLILLMSLFNRVDSVMLERLLENGKETAGIYAQSFRIYDAASQFSFLFSILLLPMFSRMLRAKEDVNILVRSAFPILMSAGLSAALCSIFYREEILGLLYHNYSADSAIIFSILMVGYVFLSTSYIYGTLLTANNNLKQLNILAGTTVVLNITLNLILIPRFQGVGAAISSLASQSYYAIVQMILVRKIIRLSWNTDILIRIAGFLALNLLTAWLTGFIPTWWIGLSILAASCVLSAFLLGLLKIGRIVG